MKNSAGCTSACSEHRAQIGRVVRPKRELDQTLNGFERLILTRPSTKTKGGRSRLS